MKTPRIAALVALFTLTAPVGAAVAEGCIELKTVAQVEETYTDAQGKPATRLVEARRAVPGTVVVWTVSARNICPRSVESIQIDSPISEHMAYIANSSIAAGGDSVVTYTLDGKTYSAADALVVVEADGKVRPARPDEYRGVRFALAGVLPANQSFTASYRTAVK